MTITTGRQCLPQDQWIHSGEEVPSHDQLLKQSGQLPIGDGGKFSAGNARNNIRYERAATAGFESGGELAEVTQANGLNQRQQERVSRFKCVENDFEDLSEGADGRDDVECPVQDCGLRRGLDRVQQAIGARLALVLSHALAETAEINPTVKGETIANGDFLAIRSCGQRVRIDVEQVDFAEYFGQLRQIEIVAIAGAEHAQSRARAGGVFAGDDRRDWISTADIRQAIGHSTTMRRKFDPTSARLGVTLSLDRAQVGHGTAVTSR